MMLIFTFNGIYFYFNNTVFHYGCSSKNIEIVKILLSDKNININARNIILKYWI